MMKANKRAALGRYDRSVPSLAQLSGRTELVITGSAGKQSLLQIYPVLDQSEVERVQETRFGGNLRGNAGISYIICRVRIDSSLMEPLIAIPFLSGVYYIENLKNDEPPKTAATLNEAAHLYLREHVSTG